MKALTKYAALALVAGLWSCTSSKLAQHSQGEYDDLYFTSKDREQALTASASSSSLQYDRMDRADDASAQQNANPDYVATDNRRQNNRNGDAYNDGDTYYDDSYADRRRFGSIRPSVAGGVYSSPAFYDPFFSPFGYDSFYARNAYSSFYYDPFFANRPFWGFRPGVSISISYNNWGRPWGWNAWNSWGHDPFWNAGPWGHNAWNAWGHDPFWGGGFGYGPGFNNFYSVNNFYGGGWGGWNRPWGGGNTYIINNGRDNTATRNYGPRGSRSSDRVNDRLDNSPRDRNNNGGRLSQEGDDTQVNRPTRARSPRSVEGDPYGTSPGTPREGYRSGRTDVNANPDVITTRPTAPSDNNTGRSREVYSSPRPARPQGSDYSNGGSNQRSTDYYNSNRSSGAASQPSQPTYSAPRSNGGSYEYSRPSRSSSDGGYNSGSSGGYNSGRSSGSSYSGGSAPASSPSPSSGGSGGSSRARGRN